MISWFEFASAWLGSTWWGCLLAVFGFGYLFFTTMMSDNAGDAIGVTFVPLLLIFVSAAIAVFLPAPWATAVLKYCLLLGFWPSLVLLVAGSVGSDLSPRYKYPHLRFGWVYGCPPLFFVLIFAKEHLLPGSIDGGWLDQGWLLFGMHWPWLCALVVWTIPVVTWCVWPKSYEEGRTWLFRLAIAVVTPMVLGAGLAWIPVEAALVAAEESFDALNLNYVWGGLGVCAVLMLVVWGFKYISRWKDPDQDVRFAAVKRMRRRSLLAQIAETDSSPSVRRQAKMRLWEMGTGQFIACEVCDGAGRREVTSSFTIPEDNRNSGYGGATIYSSDFESCKACHGAGFFGLEDPQGVNLSENDSRRHT